jgi:hypothetical protein
MPSSNHRSELEVDLNETGELLARIQVHDNRQIGAVTIEEWQHDLAKVAYADALQVVRDHRAKSTEYLTANHILVGVRKLRAALMEGADRVQPPSDLPDDPKAYIEWLRSTRAAVASGQLTPPPAERFDEIPANVRARLSGVGRRIPGRDG